MHITQYGFPLALHPADFCAKRKVVIASHWLSNPEPLPAWIAAALRASQ
jgi:hypothetical protein